MTSGNAEVAALFGKPAAVGMNVGSEIYPGYPGLVATQDGVRAMAWGFPLAMKSKKTGLPLKPKPVNNTRDDKLGTSFWRDSFAHRRCLIPVTAWAEAEGEKGSMTRTWYALPNTDIFAVAGVWRPSSERGEVYSMVMVDGCEEMADVHDRMPTILAPEDWTTWTAGTPEEAFGLCRVWRGPLKVDRTAEAWIKPRGSSKLAPNLPFLI
jgi:putative SOS response-associated peptidase YedK